MGQSQSATAQTAASAASHEEVTRILADKFATKCFTSLELYSLKDVFRSLADHVGQVRYLREDTIARFLEIPDILAASPVLFQMISYIAAFPFLQDAPAVLGLEQMVIVITLMTERYRRVLAQGSASRLQLFYKSLAVYDRKLSEMEAGRREAARTQGTTPREERSRAAAGFAVDEAGEEEEDGDDDEDDELVLAAFESLDCVDVFRHGSAPTTHGAMIPADNFRKLIMLLLLIAPLGVQEKLSQQPDRLVGDHLESLRATAEHILAAFLDVETSPGIRYKSFRTVVPASLPYLFDGFHNLFEAFLFSKNLDLGRHKNEAAASPSARPAEPVQPLLRDQGAILDLNVLSQLSFFLPGSSLFRRLRLLYAGEDDGFSMGSFETKVFHWRAPTILLVRGTSIPEDGSHRSSRAESTFLASLPPRRCRPGAKGGEAVTFGVFVAQPWQHTHRACFGGEDAVLFQLAPVHDVFPASTLNRDYASFTKPSAATAHAGVSFGCPPSHHAAASSSSYRRSGTLALGPVSLVLDDGFEFGCFTHEYGAHGGGAYRNSAARRFDFQDRFQVESLEVWGCGGDAEAQIQAERWAWEAREAEARRKINLGTGDVGADRALLEMAGIIGGHRSGGSMA